MSYKLNQEPIAGEAYTRCNQVIIDNPLGKSPVVMFGQETIVGMDNGGVLHLPIQPVPLPFDPAAEIAAINPETGELTGQIVTQADVYALIFSAYFAAINPPIEGAVLEDQV